LATNFYLAASYFLTNGQAPSGPPAISNQVFFMAWKSESSIDPDALKLKWAKSFKKIWSRPLPDHHHSASQFWAF